MIDQPCVQLNTGIPSDRSIDLLLINSPLFDTPGFQQEDSLPPLGLGYIATAVRNEGFNVALLDAVATDCGTTGVIDEITSVKPAFIGLNVFSTNLSLVEKIVTAPFNAHIIIGGPAARFLSETIFRWQTQNPITVFEGEAEHALPVFLKGKLEGQVWHERNDRRTIKITAEHPLHPQSIDLPLDRDFFRNEPISDTGWNVREAHIITTRGCGHDCAFCGAARSVNPVPIRYRTEADIRVELDHIRQRMPSANSIRVIDDLFLRNRLTIEQACRLFREAGFSWRAMAHVSGFSDVDTAHFEEMKKSGCLELFVGVESGNPARRKLIGKPEAVEPTLAMAENLFQVGISVKAYFIFGFPGETKQEMEDTFGVASTMADMAARLGAQFRASVFKFRPYHGTRIYNELVSSGAILRAIEADQHLAADKGRRQYNFVSDNFSNVDQDTLNEFIRKTQEL